MTRALDDVARPPGEQPEPSRPTAAAPPPPPAAGPPVTRTGWGVPLAVLIVGMFMSILDMSIVNVAVPAIQKVGVTTQEIQWITTSYTLCLGVVVPASAWLSDRGGRPGCTSSRWPRSPPRPRCAGWPGTWRAWSPSGSCRPSPVV